MEQFFVMYGGALLSGFFATLFLLAGLLFIGARLPVFKRENHHTPVRVSRLGGVALIIGFLGALWLNPSLVFPASWWVFSGVLILGLFGGVWDDITDLNWKYQLTAQAGLLLFLYLGGVKILTLTNPEGGVFHFTQGSFIFVGFFLFILWGVLVVNSINWLDGIDGLCASVMAVTFSILFFLSLSPVVYQPAIAILLATAVGATFAFLIYNFYPAKIIGGTSGALFFGLVTIFVSVVAGTKIATALLVLALPIIDTAFVLLKRILQKRSLFAPDKEHLHHILQRKGWSTPSIVVSYTLLTLVIGIIALSTETLGKLTALLFIFSILALILTFFHFSEKENHRWLLVLGIFLGISGFALGFGQHQKTSMLNAWINGEWYTLEVADTPQERREGLSDRESLCLRCGMLFVFPEDTKPLFWMKDMRFSLDVLWLQDNRVVEKHEHLPFPSLETFGPKIPVDKVIELPAGAAKDIPVGAKIFFW